MLPQGWMCIVFQASPCLVAGVGLLCVSLLNLHLQRLRIAVQELAAHGVVGDCIPAEVVKLTGRFAINCAVTSHFMWNAMCEKCATKRCGDVAALDSACWHMLAGALLSC